MKYMLLIYGDPEIRSHMPEDQLQAEMNAYWGFESALQQAGVRIAGDALHPATAATTVRIREGKKLTTDGPFAETKEQLGGFYLLECKDLDEAIEWAAKIPGIDSGSVEIRPVAVFEQ